MEIVPFSELGPGQGRIGSVEGTLNRARYALSLDFRSLYELLGKYKGYKAIVCGGGPSLQDTIGDIKRQLRLSKKVVIVALNMTHDWLLDRGVDPNRMLAIMIDPKPWVSKYQRPTLGVKYLLGSKLHKETYDRFRGYEDQVFLWQTWEHRDEEIDVLTKEFPHRHIIHIPGYSTVGLRALNVCYEIGCRDLELHGYDSSYGGGHRTHAYPKDVPATDNMDSAMLIDPGNGHHRGYDTNVHMARQLKEFFECTDGFDRETEKRQRQALRITVAGTGALQYCVASKWYANRTSVKHVNEEWNEEPWLMPGGKRDVPSNAEAKAEADRERKAKWALKHTQNELKISAFQDQVPVIISPEAIDPGVLFAPVQIQGFDTTQDKWYDN